MPGTNRRTSVMRINVKASDGILNRGEVNSSDDPACISGILHEMKKALES